MRSINPPGRVFQPVIRLAGACQVAREKLTILKHLTDGINTLD